jgi:hypothetical protein
MVDTFFIATSADGRPYVQHPGGPPGFLEPITEAEIAPAVNQLAQRIKQLEEEVARLKGQ